MLSLLEIIIDILLGVLHIRWGNLNKKELVVPLLTFGTFSFGALAFGLFLGDVIACCGTGVVAGLIAAIIWLVVRSIAAPPRS